MGKGSERCQRGKVKEALRKTKVKLHLREMMICVDVWDWESSKEK